MSTTKISNLTTLSAGDIVVGTDVMIISDISAGASKKVTPEDLLTNITNVTLDGTITNILTSDVVGLVLRADAAQTADLIDAQRSDGQSICTLDVQSSSTVFTIAAEDTGSGGDNPILTLIDGDAKDGSVWMHFGSMHFGIGNGGGNGNFRIKGGASGLLLDLGTDLQVNTAIDASGQQVTGGNYLSGSATIADNGVHSFSPPQNFGTISVVDNAGNGATLMYDVTNGVVSEIATMGTGATTTGALTGTTGTAGNLTVSAANDGSIYIENQTSVSVDVRWSILA